MSSEAMNELFQPTIGQIISHIGELPPFAPFTPFPGQTPAGVGELPLTVWAQLLMGVRALLSQPWGFPLSVG